DKLERSAGRRLAQTNPSRHSPRGRYWAPPKREPASGKNGTLTRDCLVVELQSRGLLFREARLAVNAILDSMIGYLQDGGTIDTVLGSFQTARRPKRKKLLRFGKFVTINQKPKRIAFKIHQKL